MQKQGEILLILVRRSGMEGKDVAIKLDIDPAYLSRLYKKETLPRSIIDKAAKLFGVDSVYFSQTADLVSEPLEKYEAESMRAEIERLKKENQELKAALFDKLRKEGKLPDISKN